MRFHSLLLRLYPKSFQNEYGHEMRSVFKAGRREVSGVLPVLLFYLESIAELVQSAASAHRDILQQDLRSSFRLFYRSPAFTITAIVVTALGIGANTAAFSIVDFVFIRQLPYADADHIVKLMQGTGGAMGATNQTAPALYRDWKATASSFSAMGAYYGSSVNLLGKGDPQRVDRAAVTASLLPILGVQPARGRFFSETEERTGAREVIISYGLWQSQFGSDEEVVGRSMLLDGNPTVVVGIMPPDFHFPSRETAVWTLIPPEESNDADRTNTYWVALGRLRTGTTVEQANAEMNVIAGHLDEQYPKGDVKSGVVVFRLRDEFSTQSRLLLFALSGAAVCVLLIACANLANLLLARALTRQRELLVRSALGAGRERLVRQSMTESLLLAIFGGAFGIALAYAALPLLSRLVPNSLPIAQSPTIDFRVVLFAIALTALTGIGFGVLPAWRSASKLDLSGLREGARSGGGRRERARSILVVVEVMASVVLLISSGLLMRALLKLQDVDPGFKAESVLTLRTALPLPKYDSTALRVRFYRDVLTEIRAIPGVSSAAYITGLPMSMTGGIWPVVPQDQPSASVRPSGASSRYVTPGFFAAFGIPVKLGRDISDDDDMSKPYVAVVSESFVKKFWPNQNPLGKNFKFLNVNRTVIGVVGDIRVRGPERTSEPQVYQSDQQVRNAQSSFFYPKDLVIRSTLSTATLVPAVRRIVQRIDPQQPISNVKMLSDVVGDVTAARAVQVRVLSAFAAIAFLLAAFGIHGLLAFSVSQRQREIGVRLALGAQRGEIVRMIVRRGAVLALAGVIPGIVIAYAAGRAMQSLLAGINPADARTFAAAALLCGVMTILGSVVPTMRAVRVDPATAFRAEV
ncbi:MAG: ABC transporter permease [Gemmatimonadaceae bacterium]